jgi:hypothetical protein
MKILYLKDDRVRLLILLNDRHGKNKFEFNILVINILQIVFFSSMPSHYIPCQKNFINMDMVLINHVGSILMYLSIVIGF